MYIHALILSYAYLDVIQKKLKESEKLAETKPRTPGLGCQCSATELRQSDNCTGGTECFTLDAWFKAYVYCMATFVNLPVEECVGLLW